jgi:hypothetical protein
MSLLNVFTNIVKAGVAVVGAPVALVADVVTLPSSAYDDRHPFERTGKMLNAAGRCISQATKEEPK